MEVIDIDESPSLRMRLAGLSSQASHTIYKVPRRLYGVNSKAYEPQTVAIGPYHHGKDELKGMEEVKLRVMQSLLNRRFEVPLEYYLSVVAGKEKWARDCYAEDIKHIKAAEFIEMLVLDGCFIIEFIRGNTEINEYIFPGMYMDLIVLENQVPFFVLCDLFDIIEGPGKHTIFMKDVLSNFRDSFLGRALYEPQRSAGEVKHILDLIHSNYCPSHPHHNTATVEPNWCNFIIPSAVQLIDANVKFEKKEYDEDEIFSSESRCATVFDVEFREDKGVMLMPTLLICDCTEIFWRNLIVYEQFLPHHKHVFTDYAGLLGSLINSSKDVQVLCQHGIIENIMGSDQEVVDFINKLTNNIAFCRDNFTHASTYNLINAYHKKRWNRAIAAFHRDYFNSPWAYVSFFAAVVLLLLTMAQTIFAALQQFK